ncbi:unnamed protein product [Cyclocybe aegerita]|uniref:Pseudouridine synthase I TruA alpha/beta domain-containing protein n=1 Tax=Cyclocybe aegerita TaxID=1973307 RepID=A0A8S0WHW2_CYCAE|nr:unnamed protein product [Cyclocybe aegerita]
MNVGFRFLSSRASVTRFGVAMAANETSNIAPGPYAGWTRDKLIERLVELDGHSITEERTTDKSTTPKTSILPMKKIQNNAFDFSKYARRKIALKFCYSGWEYGGLAFQLGPTPLPTVENVLFDAMAKAHLVDASGGFEACGWEKCGRTDRGVSAAGQVVSLWIRSAFPPERENETIPESKTTSDDPESKEDDSRELVDDFGSLSMAQEPSSNTSAPKPKRPSEQVELDYVTMLNRILPDTIRIIAWSPVSTDFSARFSCKYRHYKYFFSSLHLDIPLMKAAAERLVGEHDFRNLCKLDAQKQITSFKRKISRASITPLESNDSENGRMYVFDLVGSAFLYHQVRHIMSTLFLVGSGLEPPSMITELMNVAEGEEPLREGDSSYSIVASKPEYQMADALPLMLWDCAYDEAELDWRITGRLNQNVTDNAAGELHHQMQSIYTRSRVFTVLDQHFAMAVARHHPPPPSIFPLADGPDELAQLMQKPPRERVMNVPLGGGTFKRLMKYVPVLQRKRLDTVEAMNERWRLGKGARKGEKQKVEDREEDGNE